MTNLDWSQCTSVESLPDVQDGEWVYRGTRMPVHVVFENLGDMTTQELIEHYGVTQEQVDEALAFVVRTLENPVPHPELAASEHAHSF